MIRARGMDPATDAAKLFLQQEKIRLADTNLAALMSEIHAYAPDAVLQASSAS
jgi:hypothetical protein